MTTHRLTLALCVLALLAPASASAALVWPANDSLSSFEGIQQYTSGRASEVTVPLKEGVRAFRFEARVGEFTFGSDSPTRNRTEAVLSKASSRHFPQEGSDWWYGWYFYVPASTPLPAAGSGSFHSMAQFITMQGTSAYPGTSAPGPPGFRWGGVSFGGGGKFTYDDQTVNGGPDQRWGIPTSSVTRDVWHKFVLHRKYSSNESVGFIEVYYDDVLQNLQNDGAGPTVTRRFMATKPACCSVYFKIGVYRSNALGGNAITFIDGLRIGTTRADVDPTPPPPPPPVKTVIWTGPAGELYTENGSLRWRGSAGTVTTLAPP